MPSVTLRAIKLYKRCSSRMMSNTKDEEQGGFHSQYLHREQKLYLRYMFINV